MTMPILAKAIIAILYVLVAIAAVGLFFLAVRRLRGNGDEPQDGEGDGGLPGGDSLPGSGPSSRPDVEVSRSRTRVRNVR